ncbi:SGNH/GDSL hydrolase family protein [Shimia abyssi]|uniref:Lysophospholipase L1-like esterase n=1 Tax=Shimia abyssi TaxID=1662395 RepID=A0A2P8FD81_9RHOB|nr:SGNH/GDSL hydrolase family protein [Shimia abyssi]PSL19671.1 lysophospholipase L1-like esterase [Shimia abyssi]
MPDILCFGDSNTHGTCPMVPEFGGIERFGRDLRWPCVMARALGADWHLIEEGQPGRTTVLDDPIEGEHRNGRRVLPAIIESHGPIDVMIIMLGTNDQKARFGLTGRDIALGAGRLVEMALASGKVGRVLMVCPPPVLERGEANEVFAGAEARSAGLATKYAEVARALGVAFFDAGGVIESHPDEGVHFGGAAHRALGVAIAGKVHTMMQESAT